MATLISKDGNFNSIDIKDISKYLGDKYKSSEEKIGSACFTLYYSMPKLKPSQLMAMKRTGRVNPKNKENVNRIGTLLARRVIEGDIVLSGQTSLGEKELASMTTSILNSVKANPLAYLDFLKDPRAQDIVEEVKELKNKKADSLIKQVRENSSK
jgi:hypothetical protein